MQWILDHLAAVVIAAFLVFILFANHLRSQSATIDSTQFDTAITAVQSFTTVMEQDFANIGAGYLLPSQAQLQIDTTSSERTFSFNTRLEPDQMPQRVTYRWSEDEDVEITLASGETVSPIKMERRVDTGSWHTITENLLTHFQITLRRDDLQPVFSSDPVALAATRRIDVDLKMISPLGRAGLIEEVRWSKRIKPLNLNRNKGTLLIDTF